MQRRTFTRVCGSLLAAAVVQPRLAAGAEPAMPYTPSRLVNDDGSALLASAVKADEAFVFHYPYVTTPCFLLRLPASADTGAAGSLVGFSAICSHKMTHPARPISHISYRADPVSFQDRQGKQQERGAVISCCSERSVYDVRDGGRVLAGPAPSPLPTISLDIDEAGEIRATGSQGPDRYSEFLDTFGFRLAMEHGITDVRAHTGSDTLAQRSTIFSRQQVRC